MKLMKSFAMSLSIGAMLLTFAEARSVKIASISALSIGPGDDIRKGVEMALKERQKEFKKLGIDLSLAVFDDKGSPKQGREIAKEVVEDEEVLGVVGALHSSVSSVLGEEFNESQLAIITPTSTNVKLTQNGWKHFSRVVAPDSAQGVAAANYIAERLKVKRLLIVSDNTTYGNGLCKMLMKSLEQDKYIQVKVLGYRGASNKAQYLDVVRQIQKSQPDLIYFGGAEGVGAQLITTVRENGLNTLMMGGDGLDNSDFRKKAGRSADGVIFTTVFGSLDKLKAFNVFSLKFKKYYKKSPGSISAYSFDATNVILDAIKSNIVNKKNLSRKTVSEAVREIDKPQCEKVQCTNISGHIAFSENGERHLSRVMIMKYNRGSKANPLRYQKVYARDLEILNAR